MTGSDFLKRYEGISDSVTHVEDSVEYPIRAATAHPIYENHRVNQFAAILKQWSGLDQAPKLGDLMLESHQSYTDCGLGSERTDLIIELVKEDRQSSLFGGRITGGGSGGTVAVLGKRGATESLTRLIEKFERATGYRPLVLSGSSTGAAGFDHLRLRKVTNAQV
jgi:L-arabinokinase